MSGGVDLREAVSIGGLEFGEEVFFAGNCPEGVGRRGGDGGHAGDEGRAGVGFDADGSTICPVDVNLGIDARLLRNAGDDVAEGARLEANQGQRGVIDFDVRMIEVRPIAADFYYWAHEP